VEIVNCVLESAKLHDDMPYVIMAMQISLETVVCSHDALTGRAYFIPTNQNH